MKHYELTCLISPDLSSEELNSLQEKIISFIQEEKGILVEVKRAIRKNLGYPIRKKTQAFLLSVDFQLPKQNEEISHTEKTTPKKMENLEKKLKQEKQIFRYILIAKKVAVPGKNIKKVRLPKKIQKPKVELKEIEKKLEEILKTD